MNDEAATARAILRARAQVLASPEERAPTAGESLELLVFRIAHERYALETRHVREVSPLVDLTPVPCTPEFMRGMVNVRGRITPVIDIKKFFDLPDAGLTDLHCIIVVRGSDVEFGLLADVVEGVRSIPVGSLQASLPTLTGIRADYLKGVTADRLVVLELDRLLTDPRIIVHEEVEI